MGYKISVIIPMYNSQGTIGKCLKSLYNSTYKDFECVVVDDCSTDNSVRIAKKFPCKIIKLKKNSGPAKARNVGAEKAKGDILFFTDSDVLLNDDALEKTAARFKKNPHLVSIVGIYSIVPANDERFAWFASLQKYSNWMKTKKLTKIPFRTEIGAVRKSVFEEVGEFNTKYKKADTEDYEFGCRMLKKYDVLLDKTIQGKHHFPEFKTIARNYFKRSSMWFKLFLKRKKFDDVTTTPSMGLSVISSFLFLISALVSFFYPKLIFIAILFLLLFLKEHLLLYKLALMKKGFFFLVYSAVISYVLSLIILAGVLKSVFSLFVYNKS